MKTRMIIVAAPSGAGKSSFVERLTRDDSRLVDIITYTTRKRRRDEIDGLQYHFISMEDFQARIEKNFFVEWAKVHTNFYGTSYQSLEEVWAKGRCAIMDIDVQGVATFRSKFPDAKTIFILPPSIDELRRRIGKRDGEIPHDIEVRMANAEREILEAPRFDYQIVNDHFEHSFSQFKKIIDDLLT